MCRRSSWGWLQFTSCLIVWAPQGVGCGLFWAFVCCFRCIVNDIHLLGLHLCFLSLLYLFYPLKVLLGALEWNGLSEVGEPRGIYLLMVENEGGKPLRLGQWGCGSLIWVPKSRKKMKWLSEIENFYMVLVGLRKAYRKSTENECAGRKLHFICIRLTTRIHI